MAWTWKHIIIASRAFLREISVRGRFFRTPFSATFRWRIFSNQRESISPCPKSPFPSKTQNWQMARTSPLTKRMKEEEIEKRRLQKTFRVGMAAWNHFSSSLPCSFSSSPYFLSFIIAKQKSKILSVSHRSMASTVSVRGEPVMSEPRTSSQNHITCCWTSFSCYNRKLEPSWRSRMCRWRCIGIGHTHWGWSGGVSG